MPPRTGDTEDAGPVARPANDIYTAMLAVACACLGVAIWMVVASLRNDYWWPSPPAPAIEEGPAEAGG